MNDIIIDGLENSVRMIDSQSLIVPTIRTSEPLLLSTKQSPSIAVKKDDYYNGNKQIGAFNPDKL
jgi:hypothetical protein